MKLSILVPAILICAANAAAQTPTPPPAPPKPPAPAVAPPAPAAPAAPAVADSTAVDPVGAYEFTTIANGGTVSGTLYITGTPGSYTGKIVTNAFPEIPVTSASATGNAIDAKGAMPDGELILHFVLTGTDFKGTWALGADGGEFNGKKLPKGN